MDFRLEIPMLVWDRAHGPNRVAVVVACPEDMS